MTTTGRRLRIIKWLPVAWLALAAVALAQGSKPAPPPKKNPLLKLAQPWPDAEQLKQRRLQAEALRLFAGADPIAFTLTGDFKTVNKDHDPNSTKRYPAELQVAREGGKVDTIAVKLGARGHVRRMARTCDYVPLRVEFPKEGVADTVFDRQNALKLVVQCNGGGEFEQYLLREYLAYRIDNLLTPRSFRARLAKVSYVDSTNGKAIGARFGMFLEDDGDVAKRMEGRTVELKRVLFKDVDADTLATMMVFEYMIGNTDMSLYELHNMRLVQRPDRTLYTVAYDFDITGLVHPPYAIPMRALMIKSVTDRLYRGPCMTPDQAERIFANVNGKKDQVMALPDAIAGMDKASRQDAKDFLEGFFSSIKNAKDFKRPFVEGCSKNPTM